MSKIRTEFFSRKTFVLIFAGLFFHLGCRAEQESSHSEEIVELTFWHSLVASSVPALEELLLKFEADHPNIRINAHYIPSGNAFLQKLVTAVQSKTAPDISWIYAGSFGDLAQANAIFPMEKFIHGTNGLAASEMDDIFPALIPLGSWRGTLYGLPMEATNLALLYNRDMFREVGLDPEQPPGNWDELFEYAKRLTTDLNGDGKNDRVGLLLPIYPASGPLGGFMVWQWLPFLWQAGGYVVNPEQNEALFASEAGVQALNFWKKTFIELDLNKFTADHSVAFASKLTAMILDGPWNLPRYEELLAGMAWGVAPMPAGPAKRATNVGGEYLTIFKQTHHPNEAWSFVKWMLQPETQAFWSMKSKYLPVRKSVLEIPEYRNFLEMHPNFKVFVEQMYYAQSQRPIDYYGMKIDKILAEAIEKTTIGKMNPKTVLAEAAEKANAILRSGDSSRGNDESHSLKE